MLAPKYLVIKIEDLPFKAEDFDSLGEFKDSAALHASEHVDLVKLDTEAEMFPMKLHDKHALPALLGYGRS